MITLYGFGQNLGLVDASPFVLKVDALLRLYGLEYTFIGGLDNLKKSPKGKLPFITDDGETIGDSAFIAEHLKQKYGDTLDDWLSPQQVAQVCLIGKSLEEHFFWCLVYSRWISEENWPIVKQRFFEKLPAHLRWFVPNMLRRSVRQTLHRQGLGRHTETDIIRLADDTLSALATLLGDQDFIFGERPCTLDATLYAMLAMYIETDIDNQYTQKARSYSNLVDYCQRFTQKYYR